MKFCLPFFRSFFLSVKLCLSISLSPLPSHFFTYHTSFVSVMHTHIHLSCRFSLFWFLSEFSLHSSFAQKLANIHQLVLYHFHYFVLVAVVCTGNFSLNSQWHWRSANCDSDDWEVLFGVFIYSLIDFSLPRIFLYTSQISSYFYDFGHQVPAGEKKKTKNIRLYIIDQHIKLWY